MNPGSREVVFVDTDQYYYADTNTLLGLYKFVLDIKAIKL